MHMALFCFLFVLVVGTPWARAEGEPPVRGDIMTIGKNILTVLVTEKTTSGHRPGESVIVRVNRNTRIFNLQLQFISMGNLSPGDFISIDPFTPDGGEMIADMIHLRRKK